MPALGSRNQNDGATGPRKMFDDIFSCVDTIHQRDRRTDRQTEGRKKGRTGQTPDDSKVRRLHIASRGKKNFCIPLASVPPNTVCIARSDIDKKTNLFNLKRDFITKFALFRTGDNKTVKSETDRKCEAVRQFVADTYLNRKHWLPRGFFPALCKGINA